MTELPPKSPRHKGKKQPPQRIVQQDLGDVKRLSLGVSNEIRAAVGSAIMAFSEMEMSAEHFIWDSLALSVDDGKLVTQIDSKEKFVLAKKLSKKRKIPIHNNETTADDVWKNIELIIEARNKMAHGVWIMIDGDKPTVISYRIPIEPGQINSEHFPLERIDAVADTSRRIKKLFDAMCLMATPPEKTDQGT